MVREDFKCSKQDHTGCVAPAQNTTLKPGVQNLMPVSHILIHKSRKLKIIVLRQESATRGAAFQILEPPCYWQASWILPYFFPCSHTDTGIAISICILQC